MSSSSKKQSFIHIAKSRYIASRHVLRHVQMANLVVASCFSLGDESSCFYPLHPLCKAARSNTQSTKSNFYLILGLCDEACHMLSSISRFLGGKR